MPKSVPPAPWKPSRRGTPAIAAADVVPVVAGASVITAVALAPEPLGAGRAAAAVCARAAGGVAAGGALARRAGRRRCRRPPHLLERRDVDRGDDAALSALVPLDGRRATARTRGRHHFTGCVAGIAARAHRSSGTARTSSAAVCSTALPIAPTRALRIAVLCQRPASVPENRTYSASSSSRSV